MQLKIESPEYFLLNNCPCTAKDSEKIHKLSFDFKREFNEIYFFNNENLDETLRLDFINTPIFSTIFHEK